VLKTGSPFHGLLGAGVINQDLAHQVGRNAVKV
jgi:hypothetical protein